ncbi:hypothetical protein N8I77_005820 [Diaporthe amygdali]|uniref:Uncharacterized protein n=1 Tax=Phomopsis amygdali TaxID=1214568 RepID=A0AAD9W3C4_PHOAM|nr:hypothetical protein N8I77_005820 [Diaporthe amygdali]
MLFHTRKYQIIIGRFICQPPQIGEGRFTVSCFVYLEGEKAGSLKWRDENDRSKFQLELQLQAIDGTSMDEVNLTSRTSSPTPVDSLNGLTSVSGLDSKVMDNGGLRFDFERLHIPDSITTGSIRIHAELSRAKHNLLRGSEYQLVAEADSESFTRGDMTKHKLPVGWEEFAGCEGLR